jgi:L-asparagine transporter-like permease
MHKAMRLDSWNLAALSISVALAFTATWRYWTTPGYIYLAEEFEVFTPQQFLNVAYPLWNEQLG